MVLHYNLALLGSGMCMVIAVLVSFTLIQKHLQHFSKPLVQSKVVGILWMVPIYSIDSWISLNFKDWAPYLDMFRDCYEAYVLYLFLALLVAYLGDGDELKVIELLEQQPRVKHLFPFSLCSNGYVPHGADFLKFCKFGTMQYIVLKPASTLCAVILSAHDQYGEGSFDLNKGWVYLAVIMNISVAYAFYCLGLFYVMLHGPLERFNPVPKFLCIKAVLFLSFWQGVVVAGLAKLNWVHSVGEWTTQNVATAIQDLLICLEMMIIAFVHRSAFAYEPYVGAPSLRTSLLEDHFAHHAAVKDFNEVMPVLLPSRFKPGRAVLTERVLMTPEEMEAAAHHKGGGPSGGGGKGGPLLRRPSGGIEITEGAVGEKDEFKEGAPHSPVSQSLTSSMEKLPWRL